MLKKFIFSLTAIMALSLVVMAQDKGATTLTGSIVDKHCSGADMATHGKGCVLSAKCLDSGLGVIVDGKFTPFDKASAAKAKAALEKSKKDKGAKFKVTGTLKDGNLVATQIVEVE
jgi:type 1 fimbria pilin